MVGTIEQMIRVGSPLGVQITIWPTVSGGYQANVKERAGEGWTCYSDIDPLEALRTALHMRATGNRWRNVKQDPQPEEVDLDGVADICFEDLLG